MRLEITVFREHTSQLKMIKAVDENDPATMAALGLRLWAIFDVLDPAEVSIVQLKERG